MEACGEFVAIKPQRRVRQSRAGSPWKIRYSYAITDKGIEVVAAGKINLQDYIQSFADSVNINSIIARYKAGDLNALLEGGEGMYGNFVGMPTSMNEVIKTVQSFERIYNSLAEDVRGNFSDFGDFIGSLSSLDADSIKNIRSKRDTSSAEPVQPE